MSIFLLINVEKSERQSKVHMMFGQKNVDKLYSVYTLVFMNIDRENLMEEVLKRYLNTVMMFIEIDKRTRKYGVDVNIYNSEIHMLKAIKENSDFHLTALAQMKSITKGAASQIINRLEAKGLVRKFADPSNLSKNILSLTEKGELAHQEHMRYHKIVDETFMKYFEKMTEKELDLMKHFFEDVAEGIKELEDKV